MTFGEALKRCKKGAPIQRTNWNGANQFVYYVPEADYKACTEVAKKLIADEKGLVHYNAYFAIKTVSGAVSTWVPSVTDINADDWVVLKI